MTNKFLSSEVTDEIIALSEKSKKSKQIDPELYTDYDVKRGLRDINGRGVLAGLSQISEVKGFDIVDEKTVPCEGELYYQGYSIDDLIRGFIKDKRFGFEETAYLLIFGSLPSRDELDNFTKLLSSYRTIPSTFVGDFIMKAPSRDMMNTLSRSVLTLYAYDEKADDISLPNVLRQCLQLIAQMPLLSVYGYQAYKYYYEHNSFIAHAPQSELSTAENILHLLRSDSKYTELEARVLDLALVLHADHGGGNNSTFTTHVVTSTATDTYSTIAASLGSLKGPRHGGANIKVVQMFEDMKQKLFDWEDEDEIKAYLSDLLNKRAFDKTGRIYGMGHAVYSLSDPRAEVFKAFVGSLAHEKGLDDEFQLYSRVEVLAKEVIAKERKIYKGVSANVDFYSGFVYQMLRLPPELYTPIFAISRMAGWSAHRIEELANAGKIIRPAYKAVCPHREYVDLEKR